MGIGTLGLREEGGAPLYVSGSHCLSSPCYLARNPSALCSGSLPSERPLQPGACLSSSVSFRDTSVFCWALAYGAPMLGGCPWGCVSLLPMSAPHLSLSLAPFLAAGEGPTNLTLTGL